MPKNSAERASLASILNCYLREVGNYERVEVAQLDSDHPITQLVPLCQTDQWVICPLAHHGITIFAPVKYWSLTGRHLFHFPMFYTTAAGEMHKLDVVTLIALLTKEWSITQNNDTVPAELVYRVIESCQHVASYLAARQADQKELYGTAFRFIDAEQSLLYGHLLHPTPKSRQGLSEQDQRLYSPELKGQFKLHYFRAHRSIVKEGSALTQSATELLKEELRNDPELDEAFKREFLQTDEYAILPIHPLQARHLLQHPQVQEWIAQGNLADLGLNGRAYYPTSSIRTLYHPQARWMLKCSLNIKITNSVRLNKRKELERGVEVARLLDTVVGEELKQRFPAFQIIRDPAYITLSLPGAEESGFELVLRENPFVAGQDNEVTLLAGLGQDAIDGEKSRLAHLISELAAKEQRNTQEVSHEWFTRYLAISFEPMMWLYQRYGIALEAHQQNSMVQLHQGYPHRFYYRDNQGYYYCESTFPELERILPGINEQSQTKCSDAVADERLRYYLFINHLFGLINAFGTAGLVDESLLLDELQKALKRWQPANRAPSTLIASLLEAEQLPCKANLLTRLHDMDELVGPMESQSVYVKIPNPLVKGGSADGTSLSSIASTLD